MICSKATQELAVQFGIKLTQPFFDMRAVEAGILANYRSNVFEVARPSRDDLHHDQVFERYKANIDSGKPHHLAAIDGLAFVFRQGKHEVDANVGFRVQNGKDERLFQKSVHVVDENSQLQLFDHPQHRRRLARIHAHGDVDVACQPWLAVEQNRLPAKHHVGQGGIL